MCGWAYEGARDAQRAALEGGAGPPDGEEAVELGVGVELEELWICLWARRGLAYRLHELKSSPFRLDSQFLCCGRCVPASQRPSRLTASSSTGIRESQTHGSDRRAEGRRHLEGGRDDERVAAHAVEGVHVLGPPPKADRHLRQQRISAADQLLQEMPALSERAAPAADLPELVEQTVQSSATINKRTS